MPREIGRPRPVPPFSRASEASTWQTALEDRLQAVVRDATPVVADAEQRLALPLADAHRHGPAAVGELHRVAKQVDERLHDAVGVGVDNEVRGLDFKGVSRR
jgi:hypothetical protein